MISVEYCQLEARYNRWMNERLYAAARPLSDEERKRTDLPYMPGVTRLSGSATRPSGSGT